MQASNLTKGGLALSIHSARNNHFTGLFIDFTERTIVHYDSLGLPMNSETKQLVAKVRSAVFDSSNLSPIKEIDLQTKHQTDGFNCGRYVTYFLINMMSNEQPLANRIENMKTTPCTQETLLTHVNTWITTYALP
jgi:malate synthase